MQAAAPLSPLAAAATAPSHPLLSVQGLTTSFLTPQGWTPVLRNVSFDIHPRETLAVVGESGSGKSVTALSIMRLLNPRSSKIEGDIRFDGTALTGLSDAGIRRLRGAEMSMIFQDASLNPVYTIGFQLTEILRLKRGLSRSDATREAIALLEKVRIPGAGRRLASYPHELSGGMRQRVAIAMALACKPRLLIADEPTTALDVTIQAQIIELIKLLQDEEHMSVMFITHDMGVVAEVADRTAVMFRGDLVETGPTAEIFARPRQPYTKALLASIPRLGSMNGTDLPQPFQLIDHRTGAPVAAEPQPEPQPARAPAAPSSDAAPLLTVEGLSLRFDMRGGAFHRLTGRVHAVEDVSFRIAPGETLSLVGESGSGKSTTARAIMGLNRLQGGTIRLGDLQATGPDAAPRAILCRRQQMIFQDPFASLDPRFRIADLLAEPMRVHLDLSEDEIRRRSAGLLRDVGLSPEMMQRYPHQFSGGQRQRIAIARALALDPQLVVADEAVSALDVSVKAQVINLMMEIQRRRQLSYLFISHDMAVVERISHRVAVMYLGRIVEIGPRRSVFETPSHPYTRQLMAAAPVPDPARRHLRRGLEVDEIRTPIRPPDYRPAPTRMIEVGPGHFVLDLPDHLPTALQT
ncbi:ABC transporter ATP-binding protein [Xinfangfangia pollutisoli]|uniref:ABC transporter ATP-binding protein n=1 Tax=Xinfangfangia pollutisoli TaxID=2865960 RepID=UPI001CD79977|nr:ABC transporter ATP-binding protein [Xinfangfangia pollutisoli]